MSDGAFTELTTDRLVLRRFRPDDLDAFVAYRSDPAIARYQNWEAPYLMEQAKRLQAKMAGLDPDTPGEWFQFTVALRGSDKMIGDCAAQTEPSDPRQAVIGYTLAAQMHGQGYATEATRRLLAYLFDERGLHRVTATCDDRNVRSAALMERLGMRREGHLIRNVWAKGEWCNELLYGILRDEWTETS